jgi:phosphocarrier protein
MLQKRKCDVSFTHKKITINAKSILSLLMLAARRNSKLTITCLGDDAEQTMDELVQAFNEKFGEDQ